ncbi:MAG: SpvB/TcaC N-terminal domain-containing protein [Pseudomonadota bacterium]
MAKTSRFRAEGDVLTPEKLLQHSPHLRHSFLHLALVPILALAALHSPAASAVFATPGEFKVDEIGAASYAIPLQVPPGAAGMQPSLTLTYTSHGGNGPLGTGWSLGGLSFIHRCPATITQDGFAGGINFDANDRFCLEGQRLIAVNGAYGAHGTEYRTERESYTRVISYGVSGRSK